MEIAWRQDLSYRSRADFIKRAVREKLDRIDQEKNILSPDKSVNPGEEVPCRK